MMANNQDFILKNAIEVGSSFKTTVGTVTSNSVEYNLADASYDSKSFNWTTQTASATGIALKTDGSKLYLLSSANDNVYQYSLSIAWNVSTASYDSVFYSFSGLGIVPLDFAFKEDGTKLYILGGGIIYQHSLSTAWDTSAISYDSVSYDFSALAGTKQGIFFKPDGTKLYLNANGIIHQYSLSTAWDVSSLSYDSVSKDFTATVGIVNVTGLFFDSSGSSFILTSNTNDTVYKFTLSTNWDLSTAAYTGESFNVSSQTLNPRNSIFSVSGDKMYANDSVGGTIYQYSTTTNTNTTDLSTGNYFAETLAADTTYVFSNPGDVQSFQMEITGASTYTITWPASVEWNSGTAPDAPAAGETDVYTFVTDDSGTTYIGLQTADNLS